MPKRTDIHKVLIIGSGPIIIGQACEFDYSGTQACKALRKLGYEIVLVNSNPATIMTDPETADVTYIEPLNVERLEYIIAKERPDALLPNLGGQSGLNLCSELYQAGILDKYNVQVIGVQVDAIERGEDRIEFKKTMDELGIEMARSEVAYTVDEALAIADKLGYPVVLRPAYTMGGAGGGLVYNKEELKTVCARGLQASLVGGRGEYLGEYQSEDRILVVLNNGDFYITNFDVNNHYEDNIRIMEKFDPNKVWTAVIYDADQNNYPYIKRFVFDASNRKQNYIGENKSSRLLLLTDETYPRLEVVFGGHDDFREPLIVDAEEFIGVKSFKARGKRLTTFTVETINELEPIRQPQPAESQENTPEEEPEILDPDHGKSEGDILDEMTGQMKLF